MMQKIVFVAVWRTNKNSLAIYEIIFGEHYFEGWRIFKNDRFGGQKGINFEISEDILKYKNDFKMHFYYILEF